ncbi:tetratricopeptide repeat protein [Parerythrobacter jejuensis]|nr:tetratricopeptide repeat protein [Parerythrobacter jejuensis]
MASQDSVEKLERLADFLKADPENPALLADCAQAALEADQPADATAFFKRLEAIEPLAGGDANAAGIAAMRSGDQQAAQLWFAKALDDNLGDPGLRFNIAWSKALAKDFEGAAEMLEADVVEALPQAAMLDLQIEHELGHFDEAAGKMHAYLEKFPDYGPLQAAASVLAMDVDDPDLARAAAEKGGDHPDALTTLATLDLGDRKLDDARGQYEKALATRPFNPRAEIGLGLVDLAEGNAQNAATRLDKGAEQFVDHLGTWIAAGWAHFIGGDLDAARDRFETALKHDDTFGEAHGSLAVIELLQGDTESAERRIEVAKRLDREAFSTALAAMLWEQSQGNQEKAEQIFRIASQQPIMPNGSTLMDELIKALGNS